jgi:outer membrane biogenesis lipoprotein LolB
MPQPNGQSERIVFMSSCRMLGGVICLLLIGCASDPSAAVSDTAKRRARIERQEQLKRDWQLSRDHGRIGYVGHQAPALEGTTVPPP